jgi:hypothetical protein
MNITSPQSTKSMLKEQSDSLLQVVLAPASVDVDSLAVAQQLVLAEQQYRRRVNCYSDPGPPTRPTGQLWPGHVFCARDIPWGAITSPRHHARADISYEERKIQVRARFEAENKEILRFRCSADITEQIDVEHIAVEVRPLLRFYETESG